MPRKCSICKKPDARFSSGLKAYCSAECGTILAQKLLEKKRRDEDREYRAETRRRKQALNEDSKSYWIKRVTKECHRYIRERDKDLPCISCGRFDHEIEYGGVGGKWDAGHYLGKGAFPELRFIENNIHKQCRSCNSGSHHHVQKDRTVRKSYRENLIKKIGIIAVEELEGPHPARKYTIDELKELLEYYKRKNKELKDAAE